MPMLFSLSLLLCWPLWRSYWRSRSCTGPMTICGYFISDFRNLTESERAIHSRTVKCGCTDEKPAVLRQRANELNSGWRKNALPIAGRVPLSFYRLAVVDTDQDLYRISS
jgi:hypothetical protein